MTPLTRALLFVVVLASPWTARADWTATGQFNYTDRLYDTTGFSGTSVRPVREADVEVVDLNTLAILATGVTDQTGNFSISVTDASVRVLVGVRVLASTTQTGTLDFTVIDDINGDAIYSYTDATTNVPNHDPSTDVNFGTMTMPLAVGAVGSTNWSSQIFNTFDMGVMMADWIQSADGTRPAVAYTMGWNPNNGRGGSFYNGGSNLLSISDDDAYDDPNIIHELGHYVEDEYGDSDNTGGQHFIGDDDQDPRLSWSEGFATFVSNATLDFAARPRPDIYSDRGSFDTDGNGGGFAYELESIVTGGGTNERAVNAALYDLIDSAATADATPGVDDDPLSGLQANVWTVVEAFRTSPPDATQMETFWDVWFTLALGNLANMQTVFTTHSIDYLTDAQEPNDAPATATTLTVDGGYQENTFYRSGTDASGDDDWFTFAATAGTYYQVEVNGSGNSIFGRPDPEMFLFDMVSEQILASTNDPYDATLNTQSSSSAQDMDETVPTILWRAPATQSYHVLLRHSSYDRNLTGRYGTYNVRVASAGSPTPTVSQVAAQRMLPGERYSVAIQGSNFATDATVTVNDAGITNTQTIWRGPDMLIAVFDIGNAVSNGTHTLTVQNPSAGDTTTGSLLTVDSTSAQPPILISEAELGADAVEVVNMGSVTATLTGWQITGRQTLTVSEVFTFPTFTLAPGASVVVYETSGTDTVTELYDQGALFNWPWATTRRGDINLLDEFGNAVDNIRFVRRIVETAQAPVGTNGLWMQPEIMSPASGLTLARHLSTASPHTARGFSHAQSTMPDGATGRENAADGEEDNDEPRRATILTRGMGSPDLSIDPRPLGDDDEDWFGVPVDAGEGFGVNILFTHASGDLVLEVYAPGTETGPLVTADTTTDNETITLTSAQTTTNGGGVYRVCVSGSNGATNTYALTLNTDLTLAEILDALLGVTPEPAGADVSGDGSFDVADVVWRVNNPL